jgi:hypothetical protein
MKKFFQVFTIVLAIMAVVQVVTSQERAFADPIHEPGV